MSDERVLAGTLAEIREKGRVVVPVGKVPVLILADGDDLFALDNRCPHMGFPLHRGDAHDGLLDCHWHHARFDLSCGATLDPWADDAVSYPLELDGDEVWVLPAPTRDPREHGLHRLGRGLDDNIRLVMARAVLELEDGGVPSSDTIEAAALFGARERDTGWAPGMTYLSSVANVLPDIAGEDQRRALVHAVARVAADCSGRPPRRPLPLLEGTERDAAGLRSWLRETVEVRDSDGAERILATLAAEHGPRAALDAVLACCTDHRYADGGHTLDFAVKCAELVEHLDASGEAAALLFTSLVPQMTGMQRMEETSAWRRPVDVAALVDACSRDLPAAPFAAPDPDAPPLDDEEAVAEVLLDEDPAESLRLLRERLDARSSPVALAEAVVRAATRRVLRFGTVNEDRDWDTVHHTLTYANAVAEGMRRAPSPELFRGVLDAAASVYLDRFLNVPPAPFPKGDDAPELATELLDTYDRRARVDEAGEVAWRHLASGGDPGDLFAALAAAILREDVGFHEVQQLDLAWRRWNRRGGDAAAKEALVACARWVGAAFPTRRAREQTFQIASRLHRGDPIYESTEV
ncbi:MAG: Rieske (2Fe-2S) protein [Planctomycetota bacterium]